MEHKDYLWYIIPGTLFLLPLIKAGSWPIRCESLGGVTFLILAFVLGYIIHSVYRLIYRFFIFTKRPLIKFLINKLKDIGITVTGSEADHLYNYYFYSHKDFNSLTAQLRNKSQFSSSVFSCGLGALFGLVLNVLYVKVALFSYIFVFTIIVMVINYYITFCVWLNGDEKVLVSANFESQIENNKKEIENILKDIRTSKHSSLLNSMNRRGFYIMKKLNLIALCSGGGTNLQAIIDNIEAGKLNAQIKAVISNNSKAGALERARNHNIPAIHLSHKQFATPEEFDEKLLSILKENETDLVILAGYMKMLSPTVIREYKNRILNIHPALLPSFGGAGMYGIYVHEAVINSGVKVTGVTVHVVDEVYDHGAIIVQKCVPVLNDDTPETLQQRVLPHEHELYSKAIQLFAQGKVEIKNNKAYIKG